ncbi:EFR1 family ferrodoxin, partial [Bacteroidales bacterium OttesenSCG-928-A14]|nr:EFR1 family ferrodoxin [Bacteroidales bacterium OttesenSCG-928-A14]
GETVGFSFPIYFWGMPTIVAEFVRKLVLENFKNTYCYVVYNCGGSIGNTDKKFSQLMSGKGHPVTAHFSVFMPDNYILLMDLLTPADEIPPLLYRTDKRLVAINKTISQRSASTIKLHRKPFASLSAAIMHPYYLKHRSVQPFHTTDACTACGICAKACPYGSITLIDGKPVWDGECTQCLACLHRCPERASQYGNKTYNRGRYLNPNVY